VTSLKFAPSIASADQSRLGWAVETATRAGADLIHLDLEDGVFIPNITFGPATVRALRPYSTLPFDVHVELADPEPYLAELAEAGANILSVQVEACPYLFRTLRFIRSLGVSPGVAFNASTPLDRLPYVLDEVSVVHLMTADPDMAGQPFLTATLPKIREVAHMVGDRPIEIEVDGGISRENVRQIVDAGATTLVVGRAVWRTPDPVQALAALRTIATGA
jgi:ribulose-phosphate 3-epimerase